MVPAAQLVNVGYLYHELWGSMPLAMATPLYMVMLFADIFSIPLTCVWICIHSRYTELLRYKPNYACVFCAFYIFYSVLLLYHSISVCLIYMDLNWLIITTCMYTRQKDCPLFFFSSCCADIKLKIYSKQKRSNRHRNKHRLCSKY